MNSLDDIIKWYHVSRDSLKVAARLMEYSVKESQFKKLFDKTVFLPHTLEEIKGVIDKAENELDDLVCLSLVSVFEAKIIEYLNALIQNCKKTTEDQFILQIKEYSLKNAKYWPFTDILDFFKTKIDPDIVGNNAKKPYDYRSWVAHGKKDPRKEKFTPDETYKRLSDFLNEAGII